MPMYKEHLLGGFAAGAAGLFLVVNLSHYTIPILTAIQWLLCAFAGSLFPDVDTKSKGQKYFYQIMVVMILFALFKSHLDLAIYLALFSILPMLVRHRGLFHSIWFVVGLPLLAAVVAANYLPMHRYDLFYNAGFFIVGALSHLLMDFGIKGFLRLR